VTPTVQLLTELLPLLTGFCLPRVQEQHSSQQQLLAALQLLLQQADGDAQAATEQQLNADADSAAAFIIRGASSLCSVSVDRCVKHMCDLLSLAVVPDPNLTAAKVQAAADSAASAEQHNQGSCSYIIPVASVDAVVQNAGDVMRLCEVLLRDNAAVSDAVAQLQRSTTLTAATSVEATIPQIRTVALVAAAAASRSSQVNLIAVGRVIAALLAHGATDRNSYHPSVLALAALSVDPGCDLQRQLFSLLYSMSKLSCSPVQGMLDTGNTSAAAAFRRMLSRAAAFTAAAFVAGDATKSQPQPSGEDSDAATLSKLPSLFVLGSCCTRWAQQLRSVAAFVGPTQAQLL
jgi:hypothetical protein